MEVLQDTYKDTIFRRLLGNIPKDWNIKEISDFTKFSQGVQVNVELQSSLPSNELIRFIRIVDYTQSTDDIRYVSKSYKKYIVNENDIVMIRYGTPGIIGRNIKGVIANNMFKISIDNSLASNDYFEYFFKQKHIQEYLLMGSGSSTMPALNFSYLKKFQIALPPLQEQQKIATILSTVDEQISTTNKIIEKSKELKKGLMQKLFSEGIRHTEFKDTKIGRVPKDWEVVKLNDISKKTNQGVNTTTEKVKYSAEGKYQVIRSNNLSDNYIDWNNSVFIDDNTFDRISENVKPNYNDILYSNIGSALGYAAVVTETIDFAIAWNVFRIQTLSNEINSSFLAYFLNFRRKHIRRLETQSTMPFISSKVMLKVQVALPSIIEQQKIADILSEIDAKIEKEQTQKTQLENLKKGLMQQLLTGKKRVKV